MKYLSSLAAALILAGCATDSGTSTTSGDWTCQYCHNVEIHQAGTGFWFDFPNKDGVHYVTKTISGADTGLTESRPGANRERQGGTLAASTIIVKNLSGTERSNDRIADHGNVTPEQSPSHLSANQANVTRNGKNSQQATPAQTILGAVPVLAEPEARISGEGPVTEGECSLSSGKARESTYGQIPACRVMDSRGGIQTISVKGGGVECAAGIVTKYQSAPVSFAALTVQSSGAATITATFTITGSGKIVSEGGGTPQLRLYFQRKGDTMSGTGDYEWYRWWSNPNAVRLTPEILKLKTFKLTTKLVPGMWSSVYGKFGDENVKMFNAAVADMATAGMTFGDDFGFGHGVHAASGKPRFTLTSFTIK